MVTGFFCGLDAVLPSSRLVKVLKETALTSTNFILSLFTSKLQTEGGYLPLCRVSNAATSSTVKSIKR